MKILTIGFLAFFGWSAFSTYIYVCKIKGLCFEPVTMQFGKVSHTNMLAGDTLHKPLMREQAAIPKNMVIYFAFDKSEFKADAQTDKYFEESGTYMNQNSQVRLSITGHTDSIGSNEYNQALGYRRAQSVEHYFESKGLFANKIIIESKGEKEPAEDNNTMAGRANNRRAVITIKK
jgi:outer membrane protein OmpA-like peptidoglycan-associated protein